MPIPILTDAASLHRLADDGSFSRGEAYFTRGQVRALRFDGERITATVSGGQDYRIRLWREGGDLGWSCTCPMGDRGAFCKHAVATGLAWLAGGVAPSGEDAAVPTIDDIRAWLAAKDKAELVDMIVAQARDDDRLHQKLMLGASRRQGPAVNLTVWRGAIDQALGDGGFIEYREAYGVARDVGEVIGGIEALLAEGHADAVLSLAGDALDAVSTAMEQADDSSGELGGVLHRLKDLHLAACRAGTRDPEELAQEVFEREIEDQWGVISVAEYAEALGEAGLDAYRRLAEAEWAKLPALGPGDRDPDRYGGRRYHITSIMATLARMSGDLDRQVAVIAHNLSEPSAFLAIAELYSGAGRADTALEWAEKGWRAFPNSPVTGRLRDFLADAYHARSRHDEAMALIWNSFITGYSSLAGVKQLREHAERAGDWPGWRARALATIRERLKTGRDGNPSLLVDIFLWEGDADAAWREARAGGCSAAHWLQLAELREASHPADALTVYRERLPDVLPATGSGDYPRAIALIGKIGTLLTTLDRSSDFPPFVAALRTQHKRKRTFIALLDQKKW